MCRHVPLWPVMNSSGRGLKAYSPFIHPWTAELALVNVQGCVSCALCVGDVTLLDVCFFLFAKQQLRPCVCRRDSAVIKDEIKSFLANRRISQAVVAQVTGEYHLPLRPGQPDHPPETVCVSASVRPADDTDPPPFLSLQGSARAGSPTGSFSRDQTSANRRNGPSSVGTSWRRPTLVTTTLHHQALM